MDSGSLNGVEEGCEILGAFGLIIQGVLGLLSFMALIVKRYFEEP